MGVKISVTEQKIIWHNDCITYLLLCNKLCQKHSQLRTTKNYYFTVHSGQESGQSWVIWLKVSYQGVGKMSTGAAISLEGSAGKWSTSKLACKVVDRIQFLGAVAVTVCFLATWASPQSSLQHSSWLPTEVSKRAGESEQDRTRASL